MNAGATKRHEKAQKFSGLFVLFRGPLALFVGVFLLLGPGSAQAAKTRNELLFQMNAALLASDRPAFARCFNFAGADQPTRASFAKIIDDVFRWPTHNIFTSERKESGNPPIEQGGRRYRLNGDWQFQVHLFLSKKTSKGYVFPAGTVGSQVLVLVAVPEKS